MIIVKTTSRTPFVNLMLLIAPLAFADEFDTYERPELIRQIHTGEVTTESLEMRQYALGMFSVYSKQCSVPNQISLAADRLRSDVRTVSPVVELPEGTSDARMYLEANDCEDDGYILRLNLMRYIYRNSEIPRSEYYASLPASLFNACVRDSLRIYEARGKTGNEPDMRSWCACNVEQIDRYVTEADTQAFLQDFRAYYRQIEDNREWRLLTRLNHCKR